MRVRGMAAIVGKMAGGRGVNGGGGGYCGGPCNHKPTRRM
jgi:hypothetical protein